MELSKFSNSSNFRTFDWARFFDRATTKLFFRLVGASGPHIQPHIAGVFMLCTFAAKSGVIFSSWSRGPLKTKPFSCRSWVWKKAPLPPYLVLSLVNVKAPVPLDCLLPVENPRPTLPKKKKISSVPPTPHVQRDKETTAYRRWSRR